MKEWSTVKPYRRKRVKGLGWRLDLSNCVSIPTGGIDMHGIDCLDDEYDGKSEQITCCTSSAGLAISQSTNSSRSSFLFSNLHLDILALSYAGLAVDTKSNVTLLFCVEASLSLLHGNCLAQPVDCPFRFGSHLAPTFAVGINPCRLLLPGLTYT